MRRRRTFHMGGYFRDAIEAVCQVARGYALFFGGGIKNAAWLQHLQLAFIVQAARNGLLRRAEVTEAFRLQHERFCWACGRRRMPADLCPGKAPGKEALVCGAERGW